MLLWLLTEVSRKAEKKNACINILPINRASRRIQCEDLSLVLLKSNNSIFMFVFKMSKNPISHQYDF